MSEKFAIFSDSSSAIQNNSDLSYNSGNQIDKNIGSAKINQNEVLTFGCRLNIYESEIIKRNLAISGLKNVAVFNTCAVTNEAEKEAIQSIRRFKRQNPDINIIVTGCAVQNKPELFISMPEISKLLGNQEKLLPEHYLLDSSKIAISDIQNIKEISPASLLMSDNSSLNDLDIAEQNHFVKRTRAFLQIQNGCNHRCTFCMIPFARGNSRSVPIGLIASQLQNFVNKGYKEVVFTGVDMTAFGADLPGKPSLAQMIKRVLYLVPDLKRLRLSSIDVAEIDQELFSLMSSCERLMPHFHISLQAGDDMILKRMKRRHNRKQVVDFCLTLREERQKKIGGSIVAFGADIIAGFPTETEEMFANSLNLIHEAGLQYLHVFPYSMRDGTPAARMPQVSSDIKKQRARLLRESGQQELKKFFSMHIGKEANLLLESDLFGHTENFIKVKLQDNAINKELQKIRLDNIENNYMKASLIQ